MLTHKEMVSTQGQHHVALFVNQYLKCKRQSASHMYIWRGAKMWINIPNIIELFAQKVLTRAIITTPTTAKTLPSSNQFDLICLSTKHMSQVVLCFCIYRDGVICAHAIPFQQLLATPNERVVVVVVVKWWKPIDANSARLLFEFYSMIP